MPQGCLSWTFWTKGHRRNKYTPSNIQVHISTWCIYDVCSIDVYKIGIADTIGLTEIAQHVSNPTQPNPTQSLIIFFCQTSLRFSCIKFELNFSGRTLPSLNSKRENYTKLEWRVRRCRIWTFEAPGKISLWRKYLINVFLFKDLSHFH